MATPHQHLRHHPRAHNSWLWDTTPPNPPAVHGRSFGHPLWLVGWNALGALHLLSVVRRIAVPWRPSSGTSPSATDVFRCHALSQFHRTFPARICPSLGNERARFVQPLETVGPPPSKPWKPCGLRRPRVGSEETRSVQGFEEIRPAPSNGNYESALSWNKGHRAGGSARGRKSKGHAS